MRESTELVSTGNKTMSHTLKPPIHAEAAVPYFWHLKFAPARAGSLASRRSAGTSKRRQLCLAP